jgi:diadenosine tetraphosphate (Ap4A) HIT family hydrolase
MTSCPFCSILKPSSSVTPFRGILKADVTSEIIYEGTDFVIMPDTAPVVPYHLLIISRDHLFSMGHVREQQSQELQSIKQRVRHFNREVAGQPTLFYEHGACGTTSGSACIAHAHLHALPLSLPQIQAAFLNVIKKVGMPQAEIDRKGEYLFGEFVDSELLYWPDDHTPRQFFRQVIAAITNAAHRSQWQACFSEHEVARTAQWLERCVGDWNSFHSQQAASL